MAEPSSDYVSTGDPADDHMIEGIPADSVYQDDIEVPSWRDRYNARPAHSPAPPVVEETTGGAVVGADRHGSGHGDRRRRLDEQRHIRPLVGVSEAATGDEVAELAGAGGAERHPLPRPCARLDGGQVVVVQADVHAATSRSNRDA